MGGELAAPIDLCEFLKPKGCWVDSLIGDVDLHAEEGCVLFLRLTHHVHIRRRIQARVEVKKMAPARVKENKIDQIYRCIQFFLKWRITKNERSVRVWYILRCFHVHLLFHHFCHMSGWRSEGGYSAAMVLYSPIRCEIS